MKLNKNPPVAAVPLKHFQKRMLIYLLLQFLLILTFLAFTHSHLTQHPWAINIVFGFALVSAINTIWGFKPKDVQGRYKDIYPEHELETFKLIVMYFIPLMMVGFILFLCLKEKSSPHKPYKFLSHNPSFALLAVVMVASQFVSKQTAYWTASPSNYYIYNVINASQNIFQLNEKLKKNPSTESPIQQYTKLNSSKLTTTELVLLTAIASSDVLNKKDRSIASEKMPKKESAFKHSIMILQEMNKIVLLSDEAEFEVTDYSPLQWLSPSGQIEVMLLTLIDISIKKTFNETLVTSMKDIVATVEKNLSQEPAQTKAFYGPQLEKVKQELALSKTNRSLASVK
ncbi:MAG: hypothetical protein H0V66_05385 [Bdellovibrionales bacterium]|nr:hypothetical protein [Bdellovibrionales bacterium]